MTACDDLPSLIKVSVIVPVFNPGEHINRLIDSLIKQTMPAAERELVFVDDGCTDGTGERLDALAAEQAGVRVVHIPNSGWPGRPRNMGLDIARGEFVFFADNDDWLERDALERLHSVATTHRADIVVGKVVGHGRGVPRNLFTQDRHGLNAANAPLGLMTPHKLFRRTLLQDHGIRFPEGSRRLEDHLFVVPAYFAADRISVLSTHPIYHWVLRSDKTNASRQRPEVDSHFASVRELLAMVDERTEPGSLRDRYYLRWYRGKVLKRLGRVTQHQRDPAFRAQVFEAARQLIEERFAPHLDGKLRYPFRLRARLARRGDLAGLERLAAFEATLRARVHVDDARVVDRSAHLRVTGELWQQGRPALLVARQGERLLWQPPADVRGLCAEGDRDVTAVLDGRAEVILRSQEDRTKWHLRTRSTTVVPAARGGGGAVSPAVTGEVIIDPAVAAAGGPLPPGRYAVRVAIALAGFGRETVARVHDDRLTMTVTRDGDVTLSHKVGRASRLAWPVRLRPRLLARHARDS